MLIMGIDPGFSGGACVIRTLPLRVIDSLRFRASKMSKRKVLNDSELYSFMLYNMPERIVIEGARAMPNQGVVSMFNYGRATGAMEAVVNIYTETMTGSYKWVDPRVWKGHFNLGPDKADAIALATEEFGESDHWRTKSASGIAEAALMALWEARQEIL